MTKNQILLSLCFIFFTLPLWSKPLLLTEKELSSPPPKIIRTCCAFGSYVKIIGIPFLSFTDIISSNELGNHQYLGSKEEGNGIIYTQYGGFIDIGHLRDMADWTAYLYTTIAANNFYGIINKDLGYEGGNKSLQINLLDSLNSTDALLLAGRIAYDLSVWHELATWFGASYIPMIPEKYSSFSPEDAYSNLLGIYIGMEAVKSSLSYNEAMTELISKTLQKLACVTSREETYDAMEKVHNLWWTREKYLPTAKVIIRRELDVYYTVKPILINEKFDKNNILSILNVPQYSHSGKKLSDFYELSIKLNYKFPYKKIFLEKHKKRITSKDFISIIQYVKNDYFTQLLNYKKSQEVKEKNKEKKNKLNYLSGTKINETEFTQ